MFEIFLPVVEVVLRIIVSMKCECSGEAVWKRWIVWAFDGGLCDRYHVHIA